MISIPEDIRDLIRQMNPSDQRAVAGVINRLENQAWRDTTKVDFGVVDNMALWAIAEDRVTVGFIEEDEETIAVLHVALRSRFRPSWL